MQFAVNIATLVSASIDIILFVIAIWTFANTYLLSRVTILTLTRSFDMWSSDTIGFVIKSKTLKTIVINEVYAIFDNKYRLKIAKYDDPIILEAFRSIKLEMQPYTSISPLTIRELFLNKEGRLNVHLELVTDENKVIYSKYKGVKYKIDKEAELETVCTYVSKFNGFVLKEDFKYALLYKIGEKSTLETAFINNFGLISTNIFGFNKVPVDCLSDKDKLIEVLHKPCEKIGIYLSVVDLSDAFDNMPIERG